MNVNWKVRIKNKTFWLTLIPAVILLIQALAKMLGFELDLSAHGSNAIGVVEALFVVLAVLGIVNDPTTKGLDDSEQALEYDEPK